MWRGTPHRVVSLACDACLGCGLILSDDCSRLRSREKRCLYRVDGSFYTELISWRRRRSWFPPPRGRDIGVSLVGARRSRARGDFRLIARNFSAVVGALRCLTVLRRFIRVLKMWRKAPCPCPAVVLPGGSFQRSSAGQA